VLRRAACQPLGIELPIDRMRRLIPVFSVRQTWHSLIGIDGPFQDFCATKLVHSGNQYNTTQEADQVAGTWKFLGDSHRYTNQIVCRLIRLNGASLALSGLERSEREQERNQYPNNA